MLIGLGVGGLIAAVVGTFAWRLGRSSGVMWDSSVRTELAAAKAQLDERQRSLDTLRGEFNSFRADEVRLAKEFESLSARALDENTRKFLHLAAETLSPVGSQLKTQLDGQLGKHQESINGVVKPLEKALKDMQDLVHATEQVRGAALGGLDKQLQGLMGSTEALRQETNALATALRNPQTKGRWGEIALRQLVELSGMTEHSDFETQVSLGAVDERIRPDLIVRLPSKRVVPIDSKMSTADFLRALEARDDKERDAALDAHAVAVRARVKDLGSKEYSEKLSELGVTPEFVVMFIPGDNFFAAALARDPSLFEDAAKRHVMLASPTILLPLLRVVEIGWSQARLQENIDTVRDTARDLHDRLVTLTGHLLRMGSSLENSVGAYNALIGSYESRVMVQARKFRPLGVDGAKTLPDSVGPIDASVKRLSPPVPPEVSSEGQ